MSKVILIVDDSKSIRRIVSLTIKNEGYEIMEAIDGIDALAKLEEKPADMVLTDLNMPNMDGIELIKNLRANPVFKFTPVVFLTAESHGDQKLEGRKAGATGWIVKPFELVPRPESSDTYLDISISSKR